MESPEKDVTARLESPQRDEAEDSNEAERDQEAIVVSDAEEEEFDEHRRGVGCPSSNVFLSPIRPETAEERDADAELHVADLRGEEFSTDRGREEDELWRNRKKHIFILSSAGKPVFSRYGDESDFSELFGILQVLISMAQSTGTTAGITDALRRVTAGPEFAIHFHTAGELSYVMVTRTEESTKSCIRQLRLLHLQMLSVIPTVNAVLKKQPGYDVRRLFSHADSSVMWHLIKRMSWDPSFLFRCAAVTPLPAEWRREIERTMVDVRQTEQNAEDHMFSLILFRESIVASVAPKEHPLHVDDVLLLLNFASCVTATQRGEIWAPLCLPRFNDTGYLWCYCNKLGTPECKTELLILQLATSQEAFPNLQSGCQRISQHLQQRKMLREIEQHCLANPCFSWKLVGAAPPSKGLEWFAVCTDSRQLLVAPYPTTMRCSHTIKKETLRLIAKLRDKLSILSRAANPTMIHCTEEQSLALVKYKQLEVLALFLPCTGRKEMIDAATKVGKLVLSKESLLMLPKAVFW